MPVVNSLAQFIALPELEINGWKKIGIARAQCSLTKQSASEFCRRCGLESQSIYDHRKVRVKDAPIRGSLVFLEITKRRFYCHSCRKPFTESIQGIWPKRRTTERYRRDLLWACENFSDLKKVTKAYRCSSAFLYKNLYEQLNLRLRSRTNYPWPETIGIDEIFFRRGCFGRVFVTVIVDFKNKRVLDLVEGRNKQELIAKLSSRLGRENVKKIAIDMSGVYRSFIKDFFPNAEIVADKFHVLRLLSPTINKLRKEITGDKRSLPIRRLLLRSGINLNYEERAQLKLWLLKYPRLKAVYETKEALFALYRCTHYQRARSSLENLVRQIQQLQIPELKSLKNTLQNWSKEILNYFHLRITNGRTEGFNNVLSLVKRRAFGYRSFENFRLRALNACL